MEQPVTYQEFQEMKQYYESKLKIKDEIILGLEELHIDTINQLFQYGKEINELTELLFQSPLMHKNERSC